MNIKPINYFTRLLKQPKTVPVQTAGEVRTDEQPISRPHSFVTAYLVLQSAKVDFVKTLAELFTTQQLALDCHVASNPLFFKFDEALQYLRFMGNNNILLKAIIPHMAVEGRFETLHVRAGLLKLKHIYGGYTSSEANHFVINPCFDPNILPFVKESMAYDE